MAKAIQNLCAVVGKYTDQDGKEKNRYKKVGSVMQSDNGGEFMILDKTFNPAGINNGRDSIVLYKFDIENQSKFNNKINDNEKNTLQPAFNINKPNDEIPF